MAQATTYKFSKFVITVGDGQATEVFTAPCGLTSSGFTRTANLNTTNVPDCANPDLPSWLEQDIVSYEASISGAGVIAKESYPMWEHWWTSGVARNVKITLTDTPTPTVWSGKAILQQLTYTGERGQRVTGNINLVFDGAVTSTGVPATPALDELDAEGQDVGAAPRRERERVAA